MRNIESNVNLVNQVDFLRFEPLSKGNVICQAMRYGLTTNRIRSSVEMKFSQLTEEQFELFILLLSDHWGGEDFISGALLFINQTGEYYIDQITGKEQSNV